VSLKIIVTERSGIFESAVTLHVFIEGFLVQIILQSCVSQFLYRMRTDTVQILLVFCMPLPNIRSDSRWQHDFRVLIKTYSATSFINGGNWVISQMWEMFLLAGRNVSKDSKKKRQLEEVFLCTTTLVLSNFTLIGKKRSTRIVINLENCSRLNIGCRYVDSDVTQAKPYTLLLSIRQRALKHCCTLKPLCYQVCKLKYGSHASFSVPSSNWIAT
jgi:hypothetical protein